MDCIKISSTNFIVAFFRLYQSTFRVKLRCRPFSATLSTSAVHPCERLSFQREDLRLVQPTDWSVAMPHAT